MMPSKATSSAGTGKDMYVDNKDNKDIKGGRCGCVLGGSRASNAVESLMTPEAYASLEQRIMSGGNSALLSLLKDINQQMQIKGGSLKKEIKTKTNAKLLGQLSNDLLGGVTPYGAKMIGKMVSDPKMFKGGSVIEFASNLLQRVLPQSDIRGGSVGKDAMLVDEFISQLDDANKDKVMSFVNTAMNTSSMKGGSLAVYDTLFKDSKFEDYSIRGVKGGKPKTAKAEKVEKIKTGKKTPEIKVRYGGYSELRGATWPSEQSIYGKSYYTDPVQETVEMARLNTQIAAALNDKDNTTTLTKVGMRDNQSFHF